MLMKIFLILFISHTSLAATTVSVINKKGIGSSGGSEDRYSWNCSNKIDARCVTNLTVADMGDIAQLHQRADAIEAKMKFESQRVDDTILTVASASFFDRMNDQDKKELILLIESVVQKTIEKSQQK